MTPFNPPRKKTPTRFRWLESAVRAVAGAAPRQTPTGVFTEMAMYLYPDGHGYIRVNGVTVAKGANLMTARPEMHLMFDEMLDAIEIAATTLSEGAA